MDYGFSDRRKTKGDKRAKARYNKYKKGGGKRVVVNKKKN
jgi:hypothetical protein